MPEHSRLTVVAPVYTAGVTDMFTQSWSMTEVQVIM